MKKKRKSMFNEGLIQNSFHRLIDKDSESQERKRPPKMFEMRHLNQKTEKYKSTSRLKLALNPDILHSEAVSSPNGITDPVLMRMKQTESDKWTNPVL